MRYFYFLIFLVLISCSDNSEIVLPEQPSFDEMLTIMQNNYVLLPEEAIAISLDSTVLAQYARPTEKYPHGVMGDNIEAEQMVVSFRGNIYEVTLDEAYLFEDLRPRLFDVDNDGALEFITIRTHIDKGAGIAIYKVINNQLVEYATVAEIGFSNRWLNPVTFADLDNDGGIELVWVQTPHIGGRLKVAKFEPGEMTVLSEAILQYSNHEGRERNLCLSVLTETDGKKIFYVPTQARDKIVGFSFSDNQLKVEAEIVQPVDFLEPLVEQFPFQNVIVDEVNCIDL